MKPSKSMCAALVAACALFCGVIGYFTAKDVWGTLGPSFIGVFLGLAACGLTRFWLKLDVYSIMGGAVGMLFGAALGMLAFSGVHQAIERADISAALNGLFIVLFSLPAMYLGAAKAGELCTKAQVLPEPQVRIVGILDTSVIIDGRIADVCETGFLSGELIIPQFVLKELQMIADSQEATKRTRGRRGLDILNKMRKQSYVAVTIKDIDYPSVREVDQKLISLAKETGCAILTNDFNLNKVAEVHEIQVLNMNLLANALKPIVLPGENMKVHVIKEGKEQGQGVAYLDDGTMVVIDNGRKFMGKHVEATVTSVLQTPAGRMIFATMKNA